MKGLGKTLFGRPKREFELGENRVSVILSKAKNLTPRSFAPLRTIMKDLGKTMKDLGKTLFWRPKRGFELGENRVSVILSKAKNLIPRSFASLRTTMKELGTTMMEIGTIMKGLGAIVKVL